MQHLVIIGGGFAGLWATIMAAAEKQKVDGQLTITLISKDPYLTIRPRLYEAYPETLREDFRPLLQTLEVEFIEAEVLDIDTSQQKVLLRHDSIPKIPFDRLILAAGSVQKPLNIPGAKEHTFDIDNFHSARAFDQHLKNLNIENKSADQTILILGAGATGVELATEMRRRLAIHFDENIAKKYHIILMDHSEVIGKTIGDNVRPIIEQALAEAKVDVQLKASLAKIDADHVTLDNGNNIQTSTVVLTAGLVANPLTQLIAADKDATDRLVVDKNLKVQGQANIYATGDVAYAFVDNTHAALMSCQHAMTMGKYAGFNAARDLLALPLKPYSQPTYRTCIDLGASGAVYTVDWDRQIVKTGVDAKNLKQQINTQWIYPPTGSKTDIFKAATLEAE